jgi:hypothetical protein
MKMGDVAVNADDDDEVRTSASQNIVTVTMYTEEFFFMNQYVSIAFPSYQQRGVRGQDIASQYSIFRQFQLGFSSQLDLHIAKQGLQNLYNYCVTGEDEKSQIFLSTAIHLS